MDCVSVIASSRPQSERPQIRLILLINILKAQGCRTGSLILTAAQIHDYCLALAVLRRALCTVQIAYCQSDKSDLRGSLVNLGLVSRGVSAFRAVFFTKGRCPCSRRYPIEARITSIR
jgi:hypothetical protein